MKRRTAIKNLAAVVPGFWISQSLYTNSFFEMNDTNEPMMKGPFEPTWDSLKQYAVPEWFRDAKFGIWAHWGRRNASLSLVTGMPALCTLRGVHSIIIM